MGNERFASAVRVSGLAFVRFVYAANAIIKALSVAYLRFARWSVVLGYCFVRVRIALRRCLFAETPPATTMLFGACCSIARCVFSVSVSTTAFSNSMATAAVSFSERFGFFSQNVRTAVFKPA